MSKPREDLLQLPYAWACVGGDSCPAEAFSTMPETECNQGCPSCVRHAIDKWGNSTEYRREAH